MGYTISESARNYMNIQHGKCHELIVWSVEMWTRTCHIP